MLSLLNSEHDPTALVARPGSQPAQELRTWAGIARAVVSLASIGLLALAFGGYVNLSAYLLRGIALTTLIGAVAIPLQRRAAAELAQRFPTTRLAPETGEPQAGDPRHVALKYAEGAVAIVVVVGLLLRAWSVKGYHIASVIAYASQPLIDVKGTRVSIIGLAKGLLVILISYWVATAARRQIERSSVLSRRWDEGVRHALGSTLYYMVIVAGAMLGILVSGLQLTVLAAFAGMVGIAVGFGSQDIAKNIICGLIIMLDRSVNVGDYVDVAAQSGTIDGISMRSITIRTQDNRYVIVPNATFYTQNVVVSSQLDKRVRVTVDLAVAADAELEQVSSVLTEAALSEEGILADPPPEVVFSKLAPGALNLQLIVWTDQIDQVLTVQGHLLGRLWRALREAGMALA